MATHTRYAEIKRWAQSTGRRSIQLWLPEKALHALDRMCRERGVGRAKLLDALIRGADVANRSDDAAERPKRVDD